MGVIYAKQLTRTGCQGCPAHHIVAAWPHHLIPTNIRVTKTDVVDRLLTCNCVPMVFLLVWQAMTVFDLNGQLSCWHLKPTIFTYNNQLASRKEGSVSVVCFLPRRHLAEIFCSCMIEILLHPSRIFSVCPKHCLRSRIYSRKRSKRTCSSTA